MRIGIICIFFFLTACQSIAQHTDKKIELKKHFSVANTNNNYLYLGIENPISVAISDIPASNIIVKVDNGIISGSNGIYTVKPTEGTALYLMVYAVKNKDTVYVGEIGFRLKRIPDPIIYVSGKTENASISKTELFSIQGVIAKIISDYDLKSTVKSFELKTIINGKETVLKSDNNRLTDQMKEAIKNSNSGSVLTFQNIVTDSPDGTERKIGEGIVITVQ